MTHLQTQSGLVPVSNELTQNNHKLPPLNSLAAITSKQTVIDYGLVPFGNAQTCTIRQLWLVVKGLAAKRSNTNHSVCLRPSSG